MVHAQIIACSNKQQWKESFVLHFTNQYRTIQALQFKKDCACVISVNDLFFHQGERWSCSLKKVANVAVFTKNLNSLSEIFKINFS